MIMMRQVSSDTNIWISLCKLGALQEAFQLDLRYLMEQSAANDEILSPDYLLAQLRELGLTEVQLSEDELLFVMERRSVYPALSAYDLFALAIAVKRNIPLLTGDGHLRKAGQTERGRSSRSFVDRHSATKARNHIAGKKRRIARCHK